MVRLLSFLLMLTLMVSHGSLGAAVGNHEHGRHSHATSADDHSQNHGHEEQTVEDSSDLDIDKNSKSSPSHVHLTADGLPGVAVAGPVLLVTRMPMSPRMEAALHSAAVPPLLEPPSA